MENNNAPRALAYITIAAVLFYAALGYAYADTIRNDLGGNLVAYMGRSIGPDAPTRIDGLCASACTVYLATACVTPRARLMFHAAARNGRIDQRATRAMAAMYPAPLRAWFMANAAHVSGWRFVELSGAQAVGLGVRGC